MSADIALVDGSTRRCVSWRKIFDGQQCEVVEINCGAVFLASERCGSVRKLSIANFVRIAKVEITCW
jgi:hypothetical protein